MTIPNYAIRAGSIAMTFHDAQCLVRSRARAEESRLLMWFTLDTIYAAAIHFAAAIMDSEL
jgi:hypothetical protein